MINAERRRRDTIVIGGSAGSIEALSALLAQLPGDIPAAIAVVVHVHPLHESRLAFVLGRRTGLKVVPAADRERFERGAVYIAPPDMHLRLKGPSLELDRGPKVHRTRPAVDPLFISAAHSHGSAVVGVLLSGGGEDGVAGLIEIKAKGGLSLVQDPTEAACPAMPRAALLKDNPDGAYSISGLARALQLLATGNPVWEPEVRTRTA